MDRFHDSDYVVVDGRKLLRVRGGDGTEPSLLVQLTEQRKTKLDELGTLIEKRNKEREDFEAREASDTKPSDEDRSGFDTAEEAYEADKAERKAEIAKLDRRIDDEELQERRREEAAKASRHTVSVTGEPLTYRKDNGKEISYYLDLAAEMVPGLASEMSDPAGARERLQRHAKEMEIELPKREQAREVRAQAQIERAELEFTGSVAGMTRRGFNESPFERRVNPNRTDGQGGFFVPPLWLIDDYIPALRAGRVAAGLCRNLDLPQGTDSINIPKVSTATLTGIQTADGAGVTSQDLTDTSVTASVKTIAGQEDVAIQLIEQSPGQIIDQVITEDLMADYNQRVDVQTLLGTGSGNQLTGILPVANWSANTVTWTSSTFLGPIFNMALGAAASKTSYSRYDLTNLNFLFHPRRWFWFATTLDGASGTSGRPLVNRENVAFNVSAVENDPAPAEGKVGHVPFGPNAYIDGNLPIVATTGGAVTGGAADLALAAKWDDLWLFEGSVRTRVLPEILSGTLQVRYQLYNYVTFLVRYGSSITVIQGTGMAAPTAVTDTSITF